jgi:hypothetical protein
LGHPRLSTSLCAWLLVAMIAPPLQAQVSLLSTPSYLVTSPRRASAGDFNGDGNADLVFTDDLIDAKKPATVFVLISNGNGTFQNPVTYTVGAVGTQPSASAVADFNGDGKLDIAVTMPNGIAILFGNGDGTFQPVVNYATGGFGYSIVAADINGDGKPDLVISQLFDNSIAILLGKGNGTFSVQTFPVPSPSALAVGDFNGDGKPDLIVSNTTDSMLTIFLGKGDGSFTAGASYLASSVHRGIAVADLNHDGKADVALTDDGNGFAVDIMLGNGDGTLAAPVSYGTAAHGAAIVVLDLNHDGNPDLAVADSGTNTLRLLLGNGDGTFRVSNQYALGLGPDCLAAGDFNGDGKVDLASGDFSGDDVSILMGNGDGTLIGARAYDLPNPLGVTARGVALGDLNGDGKLDVALSAGAITLMLGNGDGTLRPPATVANSDGLAGSGIAIADFNLDGKLDLAVDTGFNFGGGSQAVAVQLGNGDGTFQSELQFPGGGSPDGIAVADFNRDGKPDIVVSNHDGFRVLLGDGIGNFNNLGTTLTGTAVNRMFAVGDFNKDGIPDVVVVEQANTINFGTRIFLGNGDGTFRAVNFPYSFVNPVGVAVGDFNGDGAVDLAVADITTVNVASSVDILLGNGDGTFQAPVSYSAGIYPQAIAVADMNQDGHPDVIVGSGSSAVEIFLGNGDGTFQPVLNLGSPSASSLNALALGDLNGDGLPDVVLVSSFGPVTVFLNQGLVLRSRATTTLSSSPNPAGFGQLVTLTATIAPTAGASGTPSGSVTFLDGSTTLGNRTLIGGTAGLGVSSLGVGSHRLTASYSGDNLFLASTSAVFLQTINAIAAQIALTSSPNPAGVGHTVTLTVTVSAPAGVSGTPSGVITYMDGSTTLGTGALTNGTASFTVSNFALGNHTLVANYGGDNQFLAGSSPPVTQVMVNNSATQMTLTSSLNPAAALQAVTFRATVTPSAGASGTPTGTVTFWDGTTALVNQALSGGSASFTTSSLTAGSHAMTATYSGDSLFLASTSPAVQETINALATQVMLTSSANPALLGQSVTLTATVSSPSGTPTGIVKFLDGTTDLGGRVLNAGTGSLTIPNFDAGSHSLSLTYPGDGTFASGSASLTEVINAFSASTTTANATVTAGQAAQFQLSFVSASSQSQTITLSCSGAPLFSTCTVPASLTLSPGATGNATVTVQTAGHSALRNTGGSRRGQWAIIALTLAFGGLLMGGRRHARLGTMLGLLLLFAACGGGTGTTSTSTSSATPPGAYVISVSATSGATTQTIQLTLHVN